MTHKNKLITVHARILSKIDFSKKGYMSLLEIFEVVHVDHSVRFQKYVRAIYEENVFLKFREFKLMDEVRLVGRIIESETDEIFEVLSVVVRPGWYHEKFMKKGITL